MFNFQLILYVAVAGAVGALSRMGVTQLMGQILGRGYPWGTLAVNILGSFTMGYIVGIWSHQGQAISTEFRAAVIVGFLGAFTTMSSFSIDSLELMQRGDWFKAISYIGLTLLGSLMAVATGFYLTLKN